jgi:hypothetical protein
MDPCLKKRKAVRKNSRGGRVGEESRAEGEEYTHVCRLIKIFNKDLAKKNIRTVILFVFDVCFQVQKLFFEIIIKQR